MRTGKCVGLAVMAILVIGIGESSAQTSAPRIELSGQFSALQVGDFSDATALGLGGRATVNLTRRLAIEGEYNFFPHDDVTTFGSTSIPGLGIAYQRRRSEAFFGPKIGLVGDRFGIFARVRPGFTRLTNRGVDCAGDLCIQTLMLLVQPEYRTEFALDLGGGVEFYPTHRTVARFDFGDTLVRHRSGAPPCWAGGCTSQNFTSRFSVGLRF